MIINNTISPLLYGNLQFIANGPFAHLYGDKEIDDMLAHIINLLELQATLSNSEHHHFDGLYPFISPDQLQEKTTIKSLLSCIHPKVIGMIMHAGFDASAISADELDKIKNATLKDGKVLRHQEDAIAFDLNCAGAYLKAYAERFSSFRKKALSYLTKADKDDDDKLATFLTNALNRHEELGTTADAIISFLYVGTTSRSCKIRFAEHDRNSCSLNALFFRLFGKTIEFPIMFSVTGDFRMALTVEAFVAGVIQLSTLQTLRKTNPKASFFLQSCDGSALTRVNAGKNLQIGETLLDYLKSLPYEHKDTPLSGINILGITLHKNVMPYVEMNEEAILDYSFGKHFFPKYGVCFSTLAEMRKKLTLAMLHSYVGYVGYSNGLDQASSAERSAWGRKAGLRVMVWLFQSWIGKLLISRLC